MSECLQRTVLIDDTEMEKIAEFEGPHLLFGEEMVFEFGGKEWEVKRAEISIVETRIVSREGKTAGGYRADLIVRVKDITIDEDTGKPRPPVVCLCGSTRFKAEFEDAVRKETLAGKIVLSVGCYMHAVPITPEQKVALDELHLRKIDLAREVLVIDVGGYIGESTKREIHYASSYGKAIRYLSKGQ